MPVLLRSVLVAALLFGLATGAAEQAADQIIVNKAKRELLLLRQGKVIRTYRVALGTSPVGPKMRQGDRKTPEGDYIISGRNAASLYHRSIRISYPNAQDRARARRQHVDPGGDVMIHGLPRGQGWIGAGHRAVDWTWGCIAVTDEEVDEIWRLVPNGTPIRINP